MLRIVDGHELNGDESRVEVIFCRDGDTKSFSVDFQPPVYNENARTDFSWYYREYPWMAVPRGSDRNVIGRFIDYGKLLGDSLLGEDFELMALRDELEEAGYSNLDVIIESDRLSFFSLPWHSLILPDASFVLSTVVKSFLCQYSGRAAIADDSVLLCEKSEQSPLPIHHYISRPRSFPQGDEEVGVSTSYNNVLELMSYNGLIDYRIITSFDYVGERPDSHGNHTIFIYDGPILKRDGSFFLIEGDGSEIPLTSWAETLVAHKCALLFLSVDQWIGLDKKESLYCTLTEIAGQIMDAGVSNVLALAESADPWISMKCFRAVVEKIVQGFSLSQAVVEARKELQHIQYSRHSSFSQTPLQVWPLPIYFESKPTFFFSKSSEKVDTVQSSSYADVRQRMHGFLSEFLFPNKTLSHDLAFYSCLKALQSQRGGLYRLFGGEGDGKTQTAHMLAFYLCQRDVKQAFYFDYLVHDYTISDIKEMIDPVVGVRSNSDKEGKYFFVFENVRDEHLADCSELRHYLNQLSVDGHHVLLTSGYIALESDAIVSIPTATLSGRDKQALVAAVLENRSIDVKDDNDEVWHLVNDCPSSLFLIENVARQLKFRSCESIRNAIASEMRGSESGGHVKNQYYAWQWKELGETRQRWLVLLSRFSGLIVDLPSVITDSESEDGDLNVIRNVINDSENLKLQQAINDMEQYGFLISYPYGRQVNQQCLDFIRHRGEQDARLVENDDVLNDAMNKILCKALSVVAPNVIKQSNQPIIHNLLVNRGTWARQLEGLWERGHYELFQKAYKALAKLMQMGQLMEEFSTWSSHVLESRPYAEFLSLGDDVDSDFINAWLTLANNTILYSQSLLDSHHIAGGVGFFAKFMRQQASSGVVDAQQFTAAFHFLSGFYQRAEQWKELNEMGKIALDVFRKYEVWPLVSSCLNVLIDVNYRLQQEHDAKVYEKSLLDDIPYQEMPDGFKFQVFSRIVSVRVKNMDFDGAQSLLDIMYTDSESEVQNQALDAMQADLFYQAGRLQEAATAYEKVLNVLKDDIVIEALQKRLNEIRERMRDHASEPRKPIEKPA